VVSWWRVDSPKIKAQNSKRRNDSPAKRSELLREIDRKVSAYLGELDPADQKEGDKGAEAKLSPTELKEKIAQLQERRSEYQALVKVREESGATQVSLTDPDSRALSMGQGSTVGYNVQAAVDAKPSLIVDPETTHTTSDLNALGTRAIKAQEALDKQENQRGGGQRLRQRQGSAGLRRQRRDGLRGQAADQRQPRARSLWQGPLP
jgi:hypothetical protein